ncbi:M15 family metallopeptidase [Pseudosulfitobacter sp. SM2401]|uniref:M15 family metallopeptidase n=1 Tax=Pseudosulfitobacter sp. SM2401 TaxID=3350098 RepID=UPI0036F3BD92
MRIVPFIILAIILLSVPLVWLGLQSMVDDDEFTTETGSGIDSGARIEIERLRQQVEALQGKIESIDKKVTEIAARPVASQAQTQATGGLSDEPLTKEGPNAILDAYAQVVLIANRRNVNPGISVGGSRWLEGFLGRPRQNLSNDCEAMTNPKLKSMLVLADVGPIRVRMLQPAVDSLTRVFEKVRATDPDLYARIASSGSLCVRQIRGTQGRTSTHSFGLAVDLNIDGRLDTLGDGKTQLGLTILADFFREEGWVWGAGFTREDSMHFEVSRQMLEQWRKDGII